MFPEQNVHSESAPSLLCWSQIGGRIAKIAQCEPALGVRLLCCPPEALHAYSIYLLIHPDQTAEESANALNASSPRKLLGQSLINAHTNLFSALRRAGPKAMNLPFYKTLNGLLHSNAREALMLCDVIDMSVLGFFSAAKRRNYDPLVMAARHLLQRGTDQARGFHDLLQVLRALGVLHDDMVETKALRKRTKPLSDYVDSRLDRCVSPITLRLVPPLEQITAGHELSRLAGLFENCLRVPKYRVRLGAGTHIFVHLTEPEHPAVASFEQGPAGLWWMVDCEHPGSVKCTQDVCERISSLLAQSGVAVGGKSFSRSMGHFAPFEEIPELFELWDRTWEDQAA